MNETAPSSENTINVPQLARAIRFAMVGIVLGLSYFSVRAGFSIEAFQQIFSDMLGGAKLPSLTIFVFTTAPIQVALSLGVPFLAFTALFLRNLPRSFYLLGGLGLFTMIQGIVLYYALFQPFYEIIRRMQGGSGLPE